MNKETREKINELKSLIKSDNESIKYFDKEIEKLEKTRSVYIEDVRKQENKIEEILAEEWRKQAAKGKFKVSCKYKEIPKIILNEWGAIERGITGGCTGDWYDGCRGCDKKCSWRAEEAFMKKYNIGKIVS
jgi:hypothetical protein